MFESGHHGQLVQLFIVARLGLGGWDISDRLEEAVVIEPMDPREGGEFHGFEVVPRSTAVDQFGFEQAVDRLGQRIVVGIADASDRGFDADLGKPLGLADADILRTPIAMVDQPSPLRGPPVMQRLFEGIEHKTGFGRARHPPTDDPPRESIDDESDIDEPLPSGDIGKIAHPQHVRPWHSELPVDLVARTRGSRVAYRGLYHLATDRPG